MAKNKYLLLISSAAVLALLAFAAVEENFLKEWRRIQAGARGDEGAIDVRLRQVVNLSLGVADRCVSCHVTMAAGEQSVRGAAVLKPHKPVVHDPAEYGCTVCHGGQGQATERNEAHGAAEFWPEPMLAARYSYAGCGRCHVTSGVPEARQMRRAQAAYERLDCAACHRLEGRGGTIRPGGGGMEGPDLSRSGITGYDAAWYGKHAQKAAAAKDGPWKTSFAAITAEDQALLEVFLKTRVGASRWVEAKSVFHANGCLGCHKVSGVGGDDGLDLTRAGDKDPGQVSFRNVPGRPAMENWMAEHFRAPASVVAGSQMPALNLADGDIELLTFYTLSLRRRELRDVYLPRDRVRAVKLGEREFATDGATLFGAFCAGCHGGDGMGKRVAGVVSFPSIANPDFLAVASDAFLTATIKDGRPGRRMAGWLKEGGLRPAELETVVRYVRTLGGTGVEADARPARWITAPAERGRVIFEATCAGCHGARGKGGEGPALNNKALLAAATDTYLVETIRRGRRGTAMVGFATASPVRPALDLGDIEAVVSYLRGLEGGKQ